MRGTQQVMLNYGTPRQQPLEHLTAEEARRYLRDGHFPPGSMGPKIEAAIAYLERGGHLVLITSPEKIPEALQRLAGTRITRTAEAAGLPAFGPARRGQVA